MRRLSKKQTGFTIVESVTVLLVLAVLIGVASVIWAHHRAPATSDTKLASGNLSASDKRQALKTYLIHECSASNQTVVTKLFTEPPQQNKGITIDGNYAIAHFDESPCVVHGATSLSVLFLKFDDQKWNLLVPKATEVSCQYLTSQGFPDSIKSPFCATDSHQQLN